MFSFKLIMLVLSAHLCNSRPASCYGAVLTQASAPQMATLQQTVQDADCQEVLPKEAVTEGRAWAETALPCSLPTEGGASGVHGAPAAAAVVQELLRHLEIAPHLREFETLNDTTLVLCMIW